MAGTADGASDASMRHLMHGKSGCDPIFCDHKTLRGAAMKAEIIRPNERLISIRKERNSRRHAGVNVCYFILDKHHQYMLVTQKLHSAKAFIDHHLASDPSDRVSVSGLYNCLDTCEGRNSGFHKNRWRVVCAPLEDAKMKFERVREGFERAVVIGSGGEYDIR
jgi:hypothetical protein